MILHIVMYDEQVSNAQVHFQVAMIQINSPEKFLMTIHGFIENIALQRVDIQKRNIVNNTSTFPGNLSYFQFNYGSGFENAHN